MAQGNAGTRDSRLEAMEAKRPLTSLVRPSATFPQKGLSRYNGSGFSPERYISRVDLADKPQPDSRDPRLLMEHPRMAGLSCYQTGDNDRADGTT